jgi:hypothetical protein
MSYVDYVDDDKNLVAHGDQEKEVEQNFVSELEEEVEDCISDASNSQEGDDH